MKSTALIFLAMSGIALSHTSSATVLTFDITGASNILLPQEYGDRVTSTTMGDFLYGMDGGFTPNVEVAYSRDSGGDLTRWTTGYNDLVNVIENEADGDTGYSVTLTADSGFLVYLNSFDIGNWGAAVDLPGFTITNGSGSILFSATGITMDSSSVQAHQSFDFGTTVSAQELILHIDTTGLGGNSDNIGLDNIQFSQVSAVPLPAAAWLFLSGIIGLAGLAAKRKA